MLSQICCVKESLHRPANVDSRDNLETIVSALNEIAQEQPILFPVHPRTLKRINRFDIKLSEGFLLLPPLGFMESLFLWKDATLVMTDSGGLQEETTALGVPCITLRENTERPSREVIASLVVDIVTPPKWDGKASERIWNILLGPKLVEGH